MLPNTLRLSICKIHIINKRFYFFFSLLLLFISFRVYHIFVDCTRCH